MTDIAFDWKKNHQSLHAKGYDVTLSKIQSNWESSYFLSCLLRILWSTEDRLVNQQPNPSPKNTPKP